MADHIKDGWTEAVLFLFSRDGAILVEHRPEGDTFIPNGGVDTEDLKSPEYRIAAVHREIREEFAGKVHASRMQYLGECPVPEIGVKFFGYAVTAWEGDVPEYTVEDGKKHADLEWVPARDAEKVLTWPAAHFFVRRATEEGVL